MEVRCIKDVEFSGRIYAKKGEMIEVCSIGTNIGFNGSNGLFFSMSVAYAIKYFDKTSIENLVKDLYK